jgi:glutathione S-transferase
VELVIGNKNYSSWSFRPWLALKHAGLAFEEVVIQLDTPETAAAIAARSPSGRVPVLKNGDIVIWESLAIIEYVNEQAPAAGLWPGDPVARGHARSIANEMHAGFAALRRHLPMNIRRRVSERPLTAEVATDVARITSIWEDTRERFGHGGPYLFGSFGAADCMFAPVVCRFHVYAVDGLSPTVKSYMAAMMAMPLWQEWEAAARAEPWTEQSAEV